MALSNLFLGWIASMSDIIQITEPEAAVDKMRTMIENVKNTYS